MEDNYGTLFLSMSTALSSPIRTEEPVSTFESPSLPGLRYSFTILALTNPPELLQKRDAESLVFIPITGGTVSGVLEGHVVPGGGDWATERNDDAWGVEARYQIRTTAGALIDVWNIGVLRNLEGESADADNMGYFMTTPVFRTATPQLLWLTRSVFVGRASLRDGGTAIEIFEVLPA